MDKAWHSFDLHAAHFGCPALFSPPNLNHQRWEIDRMASNDVNVRGGNVKGRNIVLHCQWVSYVSFSITFCFLTTSLFKGNTISNFGGIIRVRVNAGKSNKG